MKNVNQTTRMLCEGAVSIALAYALTFVELDLWFQGGSISAAMIPIILFAVRWGAGWGIVAGLAFGTLKYFLGLDSFVISWVSIVFDYTGAYAMVGLAGLFKRKANLIPLAAAAAAIALGVPGRAAVVHYISGVTVYAEWMPETFMGMTMTSPFFYSALYNGGYMLPSTLLAVVVCAALMKPLSKFLNGEDLK